MGIIRARPLPATPPCLRPWTDQSKQAMLVTRRADSVTRSFIHILACMEVGFPARPAGWPIDQYQLAELTCWQQCKLHLGLDPSLPLHSSDRLAVLSFFLH